MLHRLVTLLLLACCLHASAAVPELPAQSRPVTDLTASLSASQQQLLTHRLQALQQRTGAELVLLLVPSTGAESIEQYSMRVVEQWKPGRKDVDDGVLLLLALQDRSLRIEVGYGLEGRLTDALSSRIIHDSMLPPLRRGEVFAAVQAGVARIAAAIEGQAQAASPPPAPAAARPRLKSPDELSPEQLDLITAGLIALVIAMLCGPLLGLIQPSQRVRGYLGAGSAAIIAGYHLQDPLLTAGCAALAWFLTLGFCGTGSDSWPGGRRSGSSSSRSGGGSGGRFGGGGASGRW